MRKAYQAVLALAVVMAISSVIMAQSMPAKEAVPAKGKTEVPVTKVVLFSSGVGYFEHNGMVEDDAVSQLMFRSDQINDVLKSMVLMDLDKGTVTSVNYPSQDPLTRALRSFGVDVSGDPSMSDMLKQLRGAEVILTTPEKISGKILGIEAKQEQVTAGGTSTVLVKHYLNLVTDKGMQTIPMTSIQTITLKNERLAGELNRALELLIESHDTARKPVEIRFAGKGKRNVRIGYIAETPIWKTTYRLDLQGEKPLLQGWAIVENTSDQDWTGVNLALVSGRPISFIQDLYTPLYLPRPIVQPELYASLRPQMYDEGLGNKKTQLAMEQAEESADALQDRETGAPSGGMRKSREDKNMQLAKALPAAPMEERARYLGRGAAGEVNLAQSMQSVASAGKIGELFNFTIKDPVDLPRRRSAMLPIINSPVKVEKVSIYNQSVLAKNPLNGAYLTNDTGMKMLGGPVTVFDAGSYAGDARLDNLVPGDKRLISYAIDLNMTVDPSVKTAEQITAIKIVRGVLQIQKLYTYSQIYTIMNKADENRTVIIEHPFVSADRKLVEPAKFEEKTANMYRFRVAVDKGATKDFTVKEEQVGLESIAILGGAPDTLAWYIKNGKLSPKVKDALTKAVELKSALTQTQAKINELTGQLQTIKNGQDRLRQNLGAVGKDSELGKKYLSKLAKEEDDIEKLDAGITDLRAQADTQKKALDDYLMNLSVE